MIYPGQQYGVLRVKHPIHRTGSASRYKCTCTACSTSLILRRSVLQTGECPVCRAS